MPQTEPWRSWRVSDVVIDSSVAVAWALADEPAHGAATRIIDEIGDGTLQPVVAGHFRFEVRNALTRAARGGRISWDDVRAWLRALDALGSTDVPLTEDDRPVLKLSERYGLTCGDAHWVDVAMRTDLPLLTADLRLARAVPDEIAIVVYLGDEQAA